MKTTTTLAALTLAAGLALTGCTTAGGPATDADAAAASSRPAADAVAAPAKDDAPAKGKATDGVAAFGTTWKWDDGLKLTVKPVGMSAAGPYAAGAETSNGKMYVFDVSLENGTDEVFDPAILSASVAYGADGTQADSVFTEKIDGFFQGKVLPGKKQSTKVAFGIPQTGLKDVTLTYMVDFEHEDAIFSGPLKK